MPTPPAVRVIVKLPYTREENPHNDPEKVFGITLEFSVWLKATFVDRMDSG